ncbi:MAG: hypothetical protein D6692_02265 [Planctomycetota bacterium]|nr:MAG: hypothetical protein D6692_02265 [Planctomycetota bacterium]
MEDHQRFGRIVFFGLYLGVLALGGCSASSKFEPTGNPLLDVRNPELLDRDRVAAAERAWAEVESGVRIRNRTREAFKSLAWSRATEEPVRLTLLRLLMSDTTAEGEADSERMARLMLPTERSPQVVRLLAAAAVERGWTGTIPALVRSYARVSPNVPDRDRPERAAIEALGGGASVEELVFRVFMTPTSEAEGEVEGAVLQTAERTRDDAWTLLSRLDSDGRVRARLISQTVPAGAEDAAQREVEMLRASLRELGVLPRTGDELAWLRRLWQNEDAERARQNRAWWGEVARIVASLDDAQLRGLELRHLEAVRWASMHRPAWLAASREMLLDELAERLDGRSRYQRRAEKGQAPRPERLKAWADGMDWGDAIAVLVVDEAVRAPAFRTRLFEQVELDRADDTTEYGGVIESDGEGGFRPVLFRPRARDRLGDEMFVASGDMIRFSDRALAHYHMQVSEKRLSNQAGPSAGDLMYAANSGRTCVVFTSIGSGQLDADVYSPAGEVIDLGLIVSP